MGIPHPRLHLKVLLPSLLLSVLTLVVFKWLRDVGSGAAPRRTYSDFTSNLTLKPIPSKDQLKKIWIQKKIERLSSKFNHVEKSLEKPKYEPLAEPNTRVHAFYYAWYRSVELDQASRHWNEEAAETAGWYGIRISFYPREGLYSSKNETVLQLHMEQLRKCGIGVAVVYWKPPGFEDSPEEILEVLMELAAKNGIKVALHVAPYYNWSVGNLQQHLKAFLAQYGAHKALYKVEKRGRQLPVFYIYDPFELSSSSWASLLSLEGDQTVRNTKLDGVFFGLLSDVNHRMEIKKSHFDGFYTYFAANGYTYGSSWKNWRSLAKYARDNQLLFVPCVSPGYSEPGGGSSNRPRHKGNYFEVGMRAAIETDPELIAITSFNAWEEGSQIEEAVPHRSGPLFYLDYTPQEPSYYLQLIGWWVRSWTVRTEKHRSGEDNE